MEFTPQNCPAGAGWETPSVGLAWNCTLAWLLPCLPYSILVFSWKLFLKTVFAHKYLSYSLLLGNPTLVFSSSWLWATVEGVLVIRSCLPTSQHVEEFFNCDNLLRKISHPETLVVCLMGTVLGGQDLEQRQVRSLLEPWINIVPGGHGLTAITGKGTSDRKCEWNL